MLTDGDLLFIMGQFNYSLSRMKDTLPELFGSEEYKARRIEEVIIKQNRVLDKLKGLVK